MNMRTIEMAVGAFILAGIVSLAVLAVQVSGFNVDSRGDTYSVYANFENASGLVVRSAVTIAGVNVGKVAEISFDKQNYAARVRMEINAEVDNITVDATAAILTEGLLGRKYIGLVIGAEEEYLAEGGEVTDTQSSIVIEELVGQFLLNKI
ncbi:MAG: outer membrane lipid asymmetry maintenance protein MlaD [Pseudomonadales bacterium]